MEDLEGLSLFTHGGAFLTALGAVWLYRRLEVLFRNGGDASASAPGSGPPDTMLRSVWRKLDEMCDSVKALVKEQNRQAVELARIQERLKFLAPAPPGKPEGEPA